jgi:hypothetical protein
MKLRNGAATCRQLSIGCEKMIRRKLDPFLKKVFDLLVSRGRYSWVDIVDKPGLGEMEFRTKRRKVLKYVDEAFEGFRIEEFA